MSAYTANGEPLHVRCYDDGKSADRYTVIFCGAKARVDGEWPYLAMGPTPHHPQGFGQHGHSQGVRPCDYSESRHVPAVGKRNHLGLRITFADLPADCQRLVRSDYEAIWGTNEG